MIVPLLTILVLGVIVVPVGLGVAHLIDGGNFVAAVQEFCGADTSQRYGDAYQLLSRHLRNEITEDQLTQASQRVSLQDCTVATSGFRLNLGVGPEKAHVNLVEATADGTIIQRTATFVLVRDGTSWKIDGIQSDGSTLP